MECISENSLLYIRYMCRHSANHPVPPNLVFFNTATSPFLPELWIVLSYYTWEFLLFWASSLTREHVLAGTLLSSLGLVWVQQMGVLIKHAGWGAHGPVEVSAEAASCGDELKCKGDHQTDLSAGKRETELGKPDHSWDEQRVGGIIWTPQRILSGSSWLSDEGRMVAVKAADPVWALIM